mgnify:CR=1 FL=1
MGQVLINLLTNTTFLTVISGVLVYIFSQLFYEIIITPYKKYNEIKGKIAYILALYKRYYGNPYNLFGEESNMRDKDKYEEASIEVRKVAAELSGFINEFNLKIIIPNKKKLSEVVSNLVGISNGFFIVSKDFDTIKANRENEEIIVKNLKLK